MSRFGYEADLFRRGRFPVAGVDEAGRGPLAGPVVAAAVILPESWYRDGLPAELSGLDDSKKLTAAQRDRFYAQLTSMGGVRYGIAWEEAGVIDRINILQATHRAMNKALAVLEPPPGHVLVDGTAVKTMSFPQTPLVRGDGRSGSIAAASVLAKVSRDRLMLEYDRRWPAYGFAAHKGYGTRRHLEALIQYGPCPIHRRSFAPLRPAALELFPSRELD